MWLEREKDILESLEGNSRPVKLSKNVLLRLHSAKLREPTVLKIGRGGGLAVI